MKVLDSILDNLLAESQAVQRAALAGSAGSNRQSEQVRREQVRTLAGGPARRLRSLLGVLAQRSGALVSSAPGSVFASAAAAEVTSSRLTVATARVARDAARAHWARYEVKVLQLAKAQVNQGRSLTDSADSTLQAGINTFTIAIGNRPATTISLEIGQGNSNRQALEKVEQAINDAGAGVTAELVSDSDAGTSYLLLTASQSGAASAFALADTSGNAVSATAMDTLATAAQDARYVLNGAALASPSNTILVDNGRVEITLRGASGPAGGEHEAAATIEVGPDPVPAAALELADTFNRLRAFLQQSPTRGAQSLLSRLGRLASEQASALADIGLKSQPGGELSVDRSLLEASVGAAPERVKLTLGGQGGFATELYSLSSELLGDLVSDPAARGRSLVTYGFSLQGGFLEKNSLFGRGSRVDFVP